MIEKRWEPGSLMNNTMLVLLNPYAQQSSTVAQKQTQSLRGSIQHGQVDFSEGLPMGLVDLDFQLTQYSLTK